MISTFVRTRETWLCYGFLSFYSFFINAMGPITPLLKSDLGLSYTVSGLHYSAFAVGILLVGLFGKRAIERFGRDRSLWIGALGLSLGTVPLLLGRTPFLTIPATFLMGLVGSLILVIVPSALSAAHGELRAVALSESNVIASAIATVSPICLGFSARALGDWRPVPAFVSLLVVAAFVASRFSGGRKPAAVQVVPAERYSPRTALPRAYWVYWACLVLAVAAEFGMISWSASFLVSERGVDTVLASASLSVFMAAMIAGRAAGGALARRVRLLTLILASIGLAFAGFFLFWLGASPLVSLAGLFVTGSGIAGLYPFLMALAIGSAGTQSVRASAGATMASGAAILTLPVLLGRLADSFGIREAYAVVPLILACLAALVVWMAYRRR